MARLRRLLLLLLLPLYRMGVKTSAKVVFLVLATSLVASGQASVGSASGAAALLLLLSRLLPLM